MHVVRTNFPSSDAPFSSYLFSYLQFNPVQIGPFQILLIRGYIIISSLDDHHIVASTWIAF